MALTLRQLVLIEVITTVAGMSILTILLSITTYRAYRYKHQFFFKLCLLLITLDICTAIFAV